MGDGKSYSYGTLGLPKPVISPAANGTTNAAPDQRPILTIADLMAAMAAFRAPR